MSDKASDRYWYEKAKERKKARDKIKKNIGELSIKLFEANMKYQNL